MSKSMAHRRSRTLRLRSQRVFWHRLPDEKASLPCVVAAGGLSPDLTRWIAARSGFFLPVRVLSRVFRGKFVAGLRELHATGKLGFHGALAGLAAPVAF